VAHPHLPQAVVVEHLQDPSARLPTGAPLHTHQCAFIQWTAAMRALIDRMWAHTLPKNPSKPPYDPPYLPCPKIETYFYAG
jgi:hypothetical protein